jgi:hypothetical protein
MRYIPTPSSIDKCCLSTCNTNLLNPHHQNNHLACQCHIIIGNTTKTKNVNTPIKMHVVNSAIPNNSTPISSKHTHDTTEKIKWK